jgi:acyl-CoA reductase-like NAD-dependent aldehyde dehydrogenase
VVNPANEEVIGRICMGDANDVAAAVESASSAFDSCRIRRPRSALPG